MDMMGTLKETMVAVLGFGGLEVGVCAAFLRELDFSGDIRLSICLCKTRKTGEERDGCLVKCRGMER